MSISAIDELELEMEEMQLEPAMIVPYFELNWNSQPSRCLRWLFHLGSSRSQSTRHIFRMGLTWMAYNQALELVSILELIPRFCCWSDLNILLSTPVEPHVLSLYAKTLETDKRIMLRPPILVQGIQRSHSLSLAAKWCPSQNCAIDRETNFTRKLCNLMGITACQLRRNYLTPLRRCLHVTETLICANRWKEVDYNKVPKDARLRYHASFMRHDRLRYSNFIRSQLPTIPRVGPDLVDNCLTACLCWNYSTNNFTSEVVGFQVRNLQRQKRNIEGNKTPELPLIVVDCSGSCSGLTIAVAASLVALLGVQEWHKLGESHPRPTEQDTGAILKSMLNSDNSSLTSGPNLPSVLELVGNRNPREQQDKFDKFNTILVLSDVGATSSLSQLNKLPASTLLIHWCCCYGPVRFIFKQNYLQISGYDSHLFNAVLRNPCNVNPEHYLQAIERDPRYESLGPLKPPFQSPLHSK